MDLRPARASWIRGVSDWILSVCVCLNPDSTSTQPRLNLDSTSTHSKRPTVARKVKGRRKPVDLVATRDCRRRCRCATRTRRVECVVVELSVDTSPAMDQAADLVRYVGKR